jgi:hypothetical protein
VSGRLEACAARENAESAEEPLLVAIEQVVAPLDRASKRPLPLGKVPPLADEKRETAFESRQHVRGFEHLDPGGGELDRERKSVEALADRRDYAVRGESWTDRLRSLAEEADRLLLAQGWDGVLVLAIDMERLPTCRQQTEPGACAQERGEGGCRLDNVLQVVKCKERAPVAQMLC